MAKIAYKGYEDSRVLAAADLQKADVDGFKKTSFPRGEAVEVDDNVAAAILGNQNLFGKFEEISTDTELPEAQNEPLTDEGEEGVTAERTDAVG